MRLELVKCLRNMIERSVALIMNVFNFQLLDYENVFIRLGISSCTCRISAYNKHKLTNLKEQMCQQDCGL